MGSQDRIPVNCTDYDDFEDECQDMWSLIKSEPRADAFSVLLNGGQEVKESVVKTSWDLAPSKAYIPLARSGSSLSSDSLQLCTEGLGCESCDCLMDSSESSLGNLDDSSSVDEDEKMECEVMEEENMERDEKISFPPALQPRSFPPPLPSLCASTASYMRSVKKDGRFLLQSVKMPTQNFLQSFREGGRLKMQLVVVTDDSVLPQPSALIKPENEILREEVDGGGGSDEILREEVDGGGGSNSGDEIPALEKCSDIPEVQESEDFLPEAVSNPCNGCEIQKQIAVAEFKVPVQPQECKFKGNNKSAAAKSVENHEICPSKTSLSTHSACFNVYNSWRTQQTERNSSNICHNWQKAQPNYPVNKFKYAEANNVNLNMNVNEACVHDKVPKFKLNDLGLGRCHAPKSLSVWGKSQCIATNS